MTRTTPLPTKPNADASNQTLMAVQEMKKTITELTESTTELTERLETMISDTTVHSLKAATPMDSNKAASSTTSLSRKEANEWWANDDNTLSEVPTLSELKIAKTVGLKAIARGVAKMYQMCLFRDSLDITPKLVLKIVLTFCKQNNKLDDDHYDALVADDGKELMLLTNELMATPLGKAYISELAREGRKETYSELYTILFNIFYDGVKPGDLASMNERHAYLFHHQEGEKDEEALFPISHALFEMTINDDEIQEFSFPSKKLVEAAQQLSTLFGNFAPGSPNLVTGEREPLVTANLFALCALRLRTMKESDEKPGTITPFIDHCQVIPAMRDVLNWMAHPTFCPTIVESMLEYQKEVAYKKPQPVPQPGKKAKRRKVTVQPVVFEDDFEQEN
ncbi:hypothetical protein Ctob_008461 [Chrysochromulina tobinii]|uniref:Uncharacterized protein n=1 Tax=Chrysochromulina tobinii TaxID=1460289 RepID=A0A0M0JGD6_9EUKA|nr:hypothetical protein Ctob_008461 [Chrysochromulina tobinii]|eukprot:KOO25666.1 hypothetical protein Ctob_008461 [Chrysochromulina sp. CCMP291]